jgi:hypothetical protein
MMPVVAAPTARRYNTTTALTAFDRHAQQRDAPFANASALSRRS